ncbi:translation initiation factor IF-2-like [Hemicordylus capensis]|uniref:translation initiation factor IF-2-like n=1 Tax=Hemicordylus capensis TaxID=884348 RepID=UPI002304BA7E|nr:translation initiation factor IF-2-like [Hemicordylus capensis]
MAWGGRGRASPHLPLAARSPATGDAQGAAPARPSPRGRRCPQWGARPALLSAALLRQQAATCCIRPQGASPGDGAVRGSVGPPPPRGWLAQRSLPLWPAEGKGSPRAAASQRCGPWVAAAPWLAALFVPAPQGRSLLRPEEALRCPPGFWPPYRGNAPPRCCHPPSSGGPPAAPLARKRGGGGGEAAFPGPGERSPPVLPEEEVCLGSRNRLPRGKRAPSLLGGRTDDSGGSRNLTEGSGAVSASALDTLVGAVLVSGGSAVTHEERGSRMHSAHICRKLCTAGGQKAALSWDVAEFSLPPDSMQRAKALTHCWPDLQSMWERGWLVSWSN